MKKRLLISIVFSLVIVASCKKFLTTQPTNFISPENYYNTAEQLQIALNGVYDKLGDHEVYGTYLTYWLNSENDETYCKVANTVDIEINAHSSSNVYVDRFWQALYMGIERANLLLANIDRPAMDETKRGIIRGEALFLRAHFYFLLARSFGDVPLVLQPTGSITDVNIKRTPLKDVYAHIVTDMIKADSLLQTQTATALGYGGKANKTAVEGLLARVYLTMAGYPLKDASKYQESLKWSKKVIDSKEHSLNPDYKQIFINLAQDRYDVKESIFEVEHWGNNTTYDDAGQGLGNYVGIQNTNAANISQGYATNKLYVVKKFYDSYEQDNTSTTTPKASLDLRRDWNCANFQYTGTNGAKVAITSTWLMNTGKWRRELTLESPKDKNGTPINCPLLRYADVLLMYAEAENEVNGPTLIAYDAVNQVRRRAYGLLLPVPPKPGVNADLPKDLTKDQFRKWIQDERSRELTTETFRTADLIRWGIFVPTLKALIDYGNANAAPKNFYVGYQNLADRHLLLPIPSRELGLNKLLTQNPGW